MLFPLLSRVLVLTHSQDQALNSFATSGKYTYPQTLSKQVLAPISVNELPRKRKLSRDAENPIDMPETMLKSIDNPVSPSYRPSQRERDSYYTGLISSPKLLPGRAVMFGPANRRNART